MAQTIKVKQTAVSGRVPTTAQLQLGELAVNTYDGRLFLKQNLNGVETSQFLKWRYEAQSDLGTLPPCRFTISKRGQRVLAGSPKG